MNFEEAVENLEKRRAELKAVIDKLGRMKKEIVALPGQPGDVLAGVVVKTFLNAVSPDFYRHLERLGIAPGKISFPEKKGQKEVVNG